MKKTLVSLIALFGAFLFLVACKGGHQQTDQGQPIRVVTTLFPLFDFAHVIGGGNADVHLLLPPGVEPHHFEPKPKDLATIQGAHIFVYTGSAMEPWVDAILKSIDNKDLLVVDASKGVRLQTSGNKHHEGHGHKSHGSNTEADPHVWLDFDNARIMVRNILEGFVKKDPANQEFYSGNAESYYDQLRRLDDEYRVTLAACNTRFFLYGGHYAFNYLARRYNLTYISVHGLSPNAEPSPAHLVDMINKMKQYGLKFIFYEELASPRLVETIARETGASLLPLDPAHNTSKEEMQQGVNFIGIMKKNLEMLRKGLQCR